MKGGGVDCVSDGCCLRVIHYTRGVEGRGAADALDWSDQVCAVGRVGRSSPEVRPLLLGAALICANLQRSVWAAAARCVVHVFTRGALVLPPRAGYRCNCIRSHGRAARRRCQSQDVAAVCAETVCVRPIVCLLDLRWRSKLSVSFQALTFLSKHKQHFKSRLQRGRKSLENFLELSKRS